MINETDKELYQFNIDIVEEVRNEAMINFTDPTTEFLNYYTEKLIEAEEILEFEEYDIEFVGRNRRKVKIDGFSYDSLERSISLFVADFNNDKNLFTLTSTSITNIRNRAIAFLDFVYDGFIMAGGGKIHPYHLQVVEYVIKNNKPFLGICMGMK